MFQLHVDFHILSRIPGTKKHKPVALMIRTEESTTKSVSRETPFVPVGILDLCRMPHASFFGMGVSSDSRACEAGMPGIPTSGSAGTASKARAVARAKYLFQISTHHIRIITLHT